DPPANSELIARLTTDADFAGKTEQFEALLPNQLVRPLTSSIFAEMVKVHGVSASAENSPGFLSLWRIALRRGEPSPRAALFALREIKRAIRNSLKLAQDIEYYWAASESAHMVSQRETI